MVHCNIYRVLNAMCAGASECVRNREQRMKKKLIENHVVHGATHRHRTSKLYGWITRFQLYIRIYFIVTKFFFLHHMFIVVAAVVDLNRLIFQSAFLVMVHISH